MTLPISINDRESQKFVDISPGETAIRIFADNIQGEFVPSGLKNGGKVSEVVLVDYEWRPIPPTPLPDRNAMAIQNYESGIDIKCNYLNSVVGYIGATIKADLERFYNITEAIIIYGKSQSGSVTVTCEELS